LSLITALFVVTAALAGPADDLLAEVDEVSNRGDDAHLVVAVEAEDDKGRPASRTLEIWQKGDSKRLIRFAEPARLEGISLLVPDGETVYLFLPTYGRARRVVGEARGNAFQGTNFAMEDLSRIRWADEYTPELVEPDRLRLTPREGAKTSSARVELVVGPERLPRLVEHYDSDGVLVRRITFDDVRLVGPRHLAHQVVVEDLEAGRTTRATVTQAVFDSELSDDLFTLVHLNR